MELHARKEDPSTSHDAMKKISQRQMDIMVEMFGVPSGLNCNQIAEALKLPRDSISPNMPKLEERGLIVRAGYKRKGQQVWVRSEYMEDFKPLFTDYKMEPVKRKPKGWQTICKHSPRKIDDYICKDVVIVTDGKSVEVAWLSNHYPLDQETWVIAEDCEGCGECNPEGISNFTTLDFEPTHFMKMPEPPKGK